MVNCKKIQYVQKLHILPRTVRPFELNEFQTVIEADVIKGTKHTKDECVLLDMYNNGHIGIIPTII